MKTQISRPKAAFRLVEENAFHVTISSWTNPKSQLALIFPTLTKVGLDASFCECRKMAGRFAWLQRTYPKLQSWKGRLEGIRRRRWRRCLSSEKSLDLKIDAFITTRRCNWQRTVPITKYLARIGQVQNLLTKIGETAAFVVPEILAIDDETFAKFVADPTLTDWRIKLHKIRRMKPHVLSVPEERLLALGSVALSGYDDTFSQLTDVDMKFGVLIDRRAREAAHPELVQLIFGQARS